MTAFLSRILYINQLKAGFLYNRPGTPISATISAIFLFLDIKRYPRFEIL